MIERGRGRPRLVDDVITQHIAELGVTIQVAMEDGRIDQGERNEIIESWQSAYQLSESHAGQMKAALYGNGRAA